MQTSSGNNATTVLKYSDCLVLIRSGSEVFAIMSLAAMRTSLPGFTKHNATSVRIFECRNAAMQHFENGLRCTVVVEDVP
jgi:hypothetical protein